MYHGHHIRETAIIEFIRFGFSTEAIARARISGGTARKMSVMRMMTVSIQRALVVAGHQSQQHARRHDQRQHDDAHQQAHPKAQR